jgi:subtilisin family serine protease
MTMSRPRSTATNQRAGRGAVAIATALLAAGTLALTALPAQATPAAAEPDVSAAATPSADKLGGHDRALLATYRKQHLARTTMKNADRAVPDFATLLIAVRDGRTAEAERALADLGIRTTRTDSAVGYIKANVPFGMVDRVAAIEDVVAVDVDELLKIDEVRPEGADTVAAAGGQGPQAPSAKTPDSNAYMPTRETGSVEFKEDNPSYDGRGVTIGIMDTGVDPTHPALARTTTGERKLVDTVAGTDPRNFIDLLFDATWQNLSSATRVSGPVFTDQVRGETWKAPDSADLRIGLRPIQLPQGATVVPTLVRESDSAVWVDTDLDHDFTDEELLRPYREKQQVAHFGTDDPTTPADERIPFTVQVRDDFFPGTVSVNVNVITEAHGTHVAGITAANGMFGGRMDGQAPGARLVSMRACHSFGCSSAALTDGMIDLATKHGVDVINMSIGASPEFNDGQSARALVYNRLIDESGVQLFISAGNSGAGVNTVGDPTAADKVVSVGASVSRATWWANYGSQVRDGLGVFPFSSRGPREDGGFKPDLTAPGAAVSTVPDWLPNSSVAETGYTLPVGYSMMNAGVDIRPLREITGRSVFNEVFLDDVFVPDECVVGAPGDGWRLARSTLAHERVAIGRGSALGTDVEQFVEAARAAGCDGDPGVRDQLGALVASGLVVSRLDLRSTLRRLDGEPAAAEVAADAAVAKLVGVAHRQAVAEAALLLLGADGAADDGRSAAPVHQFLLTRCLSIAGGTTQILLTMAAERVLGLPREER